MGTNRYALLFKPGVYGTAEQPLQMKVGYYTEVAGLGASPADVTINGKIEVYNRCLDDGGTSNCVALVNFWRTLSNLTLNINALGQDGCRASANFWAVSQAASMRRRQRHRRHALADGLLHRRAAVRQRRLHRRLDAAGRGQRLAAAVADPQQPRSASWSNAVWNQVFAGVEGAPSDATFPTPPYTTLATTPVSREKPYLFVDARGQVQRPRAVRADRHERRLVGRGVTPGARSRCATSSSRRRPTRRRRSTARSPAASTCCSPRASTTSTAASPSSAPHTVVLGIGHATLTAVARRRPADGRRRARRRRRRRHDRRGHRQVAGAPAGRQAARPPRRHWKSQPARPDDALRRVLPRRRPARRQGRRRARGQQRRRPDRPHLGLARRPRRRGLLGDTERWNTNLGRNGVVVNGDDVTATGLFVEHFQQYNTVWNGEDGVDDPVPERAAVRPADPGRLDARRRRGLGRLQGRRPGQDAPRSTAAASTSSTGTTRRSTPRTASRCRRRPASSCTTS